MTAAITSAIHLHGAAFMQGAERKTPLRGTLLHGEPMARHTSWRVGGPAESFYIPADVDDLGVFLSTRPGDEPVVMIGLGSNLLVRDGGIPGSVVLTSGALNVLEAAGDGRIRAGAGVPCARVARFSAERGLRGAEFLAGIPGTMGGALAMNAGAFGSETWDIVERVETIDRGGERRRRGRDEFRIAYRTVTAPAAEWFIAGELVLEPDADGGAAARIRELLARRAAGQPTGVFSCGSVFRNPPGDFAGRLIDACGLKGMQRGGARVSEKHANFIINDGSASAADIEELIFAVREAVHGKTGVTLEPEVRIVGRQRGPE